MHFLFCLYFWCRVCMIILSKFESFFCNIALTQIRETRSKFIVYIDYSLYFRKMRVVRQ